ncbi:unnamed protein product [Thlaspi arvense]|uniref:Uncharacterized protein n=1 Tax=Thlaspi arvense TaxID=13288 RepID=A0AAU9SNC6_THLAR|nr:unnamed protein product [Thlaspi arvense]
MKLSLLLVTQSGSVDDLYSLIQKDPCVLENVDVIPFIHTPLHEASSTGKMDLAMELMILKPSFAKKLNENGLSPLHLAVENHQVELAQELIKFDPSLIRIRGRGGMTALHLVAKKGDVDLLTEFLQACPESIRDVNVKGETALHIAVMNKKHEELKLITGWIQRRRKRDARSTEIHVLDRRDREGNTALHLAAYQNDHKAVKQLLKCMSLNRNIKNNIGLTALDVSGANGSHMNKATAKIIKKSGGKTGESLSKAQPKSVVLRAPVTFWEYCSTGMARYRSRTPDGARNALLVITALIITATYQTATQPVDKDKEKAADWQMSYQTFILSIVLTFILLPVGSAYTWWYIFIMGPLVCSYGLSVYMKYSPSIFVYMYQMVVLGFLIYGLVFYVRWKRHRQKKVPNPKSELISVSLRTMGFKLSHLSCGSVIRGMQRGATYQTAVQPVDKDQKDEISLIDVLSEIVLLWGFQTSVGLTFILLPVGRAYTCWYTFLMVPLVCSYGFSVWMKYSLEISFYLHLMVGFGFLIYSLVFYVRWKFTKQHKVPNPKCRLLSESLETMV